MEATCWKYDSQKPIYRIQFDKVDGRSKERLIANMSKSGWSVSGGAIGETKEYSILFTKEFETTQHLFKWARMFDACVIFLEKESGEAVQLNNKKRGRPRKNEKETNRNLD